MNERKPTIIYFRVTSRIAKELQAIAEKEHNSVSAVVRRLLSIGLALEERGGRKR
jgi:hypothetical protein